MSAIWGYFSFDNEIPADIDEKMSDPYKRKCKIDKYSHEVFGNAYFACGIQFITRESRNEILPFYDENKGLMITADAILDNRRDLIKELGIDDPDLPDGMIMYQGFLKWGIDCLKHFRGLFSMAVYDKNEDCLYIGTDQCSQRVIHYLRTDTGIYFSTLSEPIRNITGNSLTNYDYVIDYLTAPGMMPNLSSEETAFSMIFKVEPGVYFKFSKESTEKTKYFLLDGKIFPFAGDIPVHKGSLKNYGEEFLSLYKKCVSDCLRTDKNVAISLSSGLDSASVAALASDLLASDGKELFAYTYVPYFSQANLGNIVNDETEDVKLISKMHPNINNRFLNNSGKNCLESLKETLDILEMPVKAYGNLPSLREIYDEAGKEGCSVVLTGQFGNSTVSHGLIDDVLLTLYEKKKYFKMLKYLNKYSVHVKESRKKALKGCLKYFKHAVSVKAVPGYGIDEYKPDNEFVMLDRTPGYKYKLRFSGSVIDMIANIPSDERDYHRKLYHPAPLSYIGDYETKLGLKYGVVLRDPTRDIRMLYFCKNLPFEVFALDGTPRWLIRNGLKGLLPDELLDNWMRYGMQNADCLERIFRDREITIPLITEMLTDSRYHIIDIKKAEEMLKSDTDFTKGKAALTFDHIVFSAIFNYFVNTYEKK